MPLVTIILAEDRDYLRNAYAGIIKNEKDSFQLLASVSNGHDLVQKAILLQPDIILTDLKMPVMDGIEACRLLEETHPHIRKIIISMYDDYYMNLQLLKAGVRGFLLKNTSSAEVISCIKQVHNGGMYYHEGIASLVANKMKEKQEPVEDELEVLRRMCRQQTTKTIALETCKSESAVNHIRAELKRKAKAQNDFGIAMWAVSNGYVSVKEF